MDGSYSTGWHIEGDHDLPNQVAISTGFTVLGYVCTHQDLGKDMLTEHNKSCFNGIS